MIGTRAYSNAAQKAPAPQPLVCRDLISVRDLSPDEIKWLFQLTRAIKKKPADFRDALTGKQLVLFFEKASLRTRLTFEAGIASMGGAAFFIDQTHCRLGQREPLCDVAHNVERWVNGVVLRTFEHQTIVEMARHACIPVINALSDVEHPCQALADFFTLQEKFGDLRNVHLAYVGDGNNVAHSLMLAAASVGGKLSLATPCDYRPNSEISDAAQAIAAKTGAQIEIMEDPFQLSARKSSRLIKSMKSSWRRRHQKPSSCTVFPRIAAKKLLPA